MNRPLMGGSLRGFATKERIESNKNGLNVGGEFRQNHWRQNHEEFFYIQLLEMILSTIILSKKAAVELLLIKGFLG